MINLGEKYFQQANNTRGTAAVRLYVKASYEYTLSNQNDKAGLSYECSADIFLNSNLKYQAALNYIKASDHYHIIDNVKAIATLTTAVNLLKNTKHIKLTAINLDRLASLNRKEKRFLEAIKLYEKAYRNYKYLNMHEEAFRSFLRISNIMIQNEEYGKAIVHLEKLDQPNKDVFFDIGILRLYVNDTTVCTEFLMRQDTFMLTREYFLLNELIVALNENNKNKFRKLLIDYHEVFSLQRWQFNLLVSVLSRM